MKLFAAPAVLAGAVLVAAAQAAGAADPTATIKAFGMFETMRGAKAEKNERSAAGELHAVVSRRLVRPGTEVFGQLGSSFGLDLRFENLPATFATVTVRTMHPPITNPRTGQTTTVSEFEWLVWAGQDLYFGHTFDHLWQLAEGMWTSQVIYRGKVLAEQAFKVVVPLN
jgi:hypothetical protein